MANASEAISNDSGLGAIADLLKLVTAVKGGDTSQTQTVTESGGPETVSSSFQSSSSTPGDLAPLRAVLEQQMPLGTLEGMAPILQAIFSEGSKSLPDIFSRAGATGSRVTHNSTVAALQNQLATDLANKVAMLLSANQQASAKTAEAIAAQGRRTSSSGGSSSVTKPGTRTTTSTTKGKTAGALGANGGKNALALLLGGTALNKFAAPAFGAAKDVIGSLFSGSGNLGSGLDINSAGVGLQPTGGLGLQVPGSTALDSLNFAGLSDLASPANPSLLDNSAGGLQLPDFDSGGGGGGGDALDFGENAFDSAGYTPTDFNSFGNLSDFSFDFGGQGIQVPTLPTGDAIGDVAPADYTPTDFGNFGVDFGGLGLKPEDFESFFGGAFADGGKIERTRGGARYSLGDNPVIERISAQNFASPPRPQAFTGSRTPAPTTVNKPAPQTQVVIPPTPITREQAYADYRKNLLFQELYGNEDRIGSWKNFTDTASTMQKTDPLFIGETLFDQFGRIALDENGQPLRTGGFNLDDGGMGASLVFGSMLVQNPNERQFYDKDVAEFQRIKELVPVSTTLEGARKLFPGIEKLSAEIQQAIADDPRRYAAGTRGLLAYNDSDNKLFLDQEWSNYTTKFKASGDFRYVEGPENFPFKGTGLQAARWHPQYGLMFPDSAFRPDTSKTLGILAPILSAASLFFPTLAPFAGMANTANAADKGDDFGAAMGALQTVGGAAGISGATDVSKYIKIGTNLAKVGNLYFKYEEYQDYLDKLDEQKKGNLGETPAAPTPVDPKTEQPITEQPRNVTGKQLQQRIQGRAASVPITERIFGENSILTDKNLGGVGSPAFSSDTQVTLETLPQLMNLANSINGVTAESVIPKKADGGRIPFKMQMIDRIIDGTSTRVQEDPKGNYSTGGLSPDEELARFRGVTPQQIEQERAKKLRDALQKRKVPAPSGYLQGPGTPTSDSMLIAASTDEYVLPNDVVTLLGGPEVLDKILQQLHQPV